MTVAELIEKLEKMPPSHAVIMEQSASRAIYQRGWVAPVDVQPDRENVMLVIY